MDDNPYKSPKSEPKVEAPPPNPSPKSPNPWGQMPWIPAILYGVTALGGLVTAQAVIVDTFWPDVAPTFQLKQRMLLRYALLASPIGVLMAWWTWRFPNSKRAFWVAVSLTASGFVLALIFMILFGRR